MTLKIFTSKLPCIPSYSHVKCKLWTDYDKIMKVYLVWERWSGVSNGRICWYLTCASEQVSLWFASLTVERTTELTTETWDSSHQHSKHEQSCYLTSPGLCCLSLNVPEMMTRLAGTWITSKCLVVLICFSVSTLSARLSKWREEWLWPHNNTHCLHLLCLKMSAALSINIAIESSDSTKDYFIKIFC